MGKKQRRKSSKKQSKSQRDSKNNQKNLYDTSNNVVSQRNINSGKMEIEEKQNPKKIKYSDRIFRNQYMRQIISEGSTLYHAHCKHCNKEVLVENLYMHLKSGSHGNKTPKSEEESLETLKEAINNFSGQKKLKKEEKDLKGSENHIQSYLEYLAFCISESRFQSLDYSFRICC